MALQTPSNRSALAKGGPSQPLTSSATGTVVPRSVMGPTKEKSTQFNLYIVLYLGLALLAVCFIIGFMVAEGILPFEFRAGEDASSGNFHVNGLIDWLVVGTLCAMLPYGFLANRRASRIEEIESRLPDFLRDVAEAGRFGMTLPEAIIVASKGRYGLLTEEIKRMASQLEWGVPVSHSLTLFQQRVDTPLVRRVVSIIIKANEAGGNVADVLGMVAKDTREVQLNEEQRRITMLTYLMVIVISFFVFLATIAIMAYTFLPEMITAGVGLQSSTAANSAVGISVTFIPEVFLAFLAAVIVHAIGDGIMAGVIHSGRISEGMMMGGILLLIGWAFLRFLVPNIVLPAPTSATGAG